MTRALAALLALTSFAAEAAPSGSFGTGGISFEQPTRVRFTLGTGLFGAAPGHSILPPIAPDGSSVFKRGSTVPAKFRVCGASGRSIGTPGLVRGFTLSSGAAPGSTTKDTAFRWDPTAQQWSFNLATRALPPSPQLQILLDSRRSPSPSA